MKEHKQAGEAAESRAADHDDGNQKLAIAQKLRSRERAADRYNQAHPELVMEFNQLTGDACGGAAYADAKQVREWQRAHGVSPADGKVGKDTLAAAKKHAKKTSDYFEDEGVADGPSTENPDLEDHLLDDTEQPKGGDTGETLEKAGETVERVHSGLELTEDLEGEPEWVRAAMAPAIVELLREGRYQEAIETLAGQFGPDDILEGLSFACEKLGMHSYLPLIAKAIPFATAANAAWEMVQWSYEGLKQIGEAHEAGDRDSRIAIYAGAFADCFLHGEAAGETAGAITAEQKEAVERGRQDGAATAAKTGAEAAAVGRMLLRKYGSEHNAKQAIVDQLMQRAGFDGIKLHHG
jgi:hypothetical protein